MDPELQEESEDFLVKAGHTGLGFAYHLSAVRLCFSHSGAGYWLTFPLLFCHFLLPVALAVVVGAHSGASLKPGCGEETQSGG